MKMYAIAYRDTFDDVNEWHLRRKVWVSREDAQREADEFEADGADLQTICTVVELEVVE